MYVALAVLVLLRFYLTFKLPILADEAYYVFWGTHPAGGYYDLPPMIGWWEALITKFSLHPFWIRFPNLLVTGLIALGIYDVMKRFGAERAKWLALIYFALPFHLLGVLISPDVPLIFFSFFSAILFFHADQKRLCARDEHKKTPATVWMGYFLSGALWGAAYLSKYFAVMLVPALMVWIWMSRKNNSERMRGLVSLVWVALGALPFVFQHLWWNSQNCMANFVFNLVSRQGAVDGPVYQTFGLYVLYLLILVTPVFYGDLFLSPKTQLTDEGAVREFEQFEEEARFRKFCLSLWLVPVGLFGLTALMSKGQGIHWYLSYLPFFFMWLAFKMDDQKLKRRARQVMVMTGVLVVIASSLISVPSLVTNNILKNRFRLDIEMSMNGKQLVELLSPFVQNSDVFMTNGYVFSSVLDMQFRRYGVMNRAGEPFTVGMWGPGSRFGRVFDWTTDYKQLNGKSITLFSGGHVPHYDFSDYFAESRTEILNINGAEFNVLVGTGFKAEEFIQKLLLPSINQFYPKFILQAKCPVKEKLL